MCGGEGGLDPSRMCGGEGGLDPSRVCGGEGGLDFFIILVCMILVIL